MKNTGPYYRNTFTFRCKTCIEILRKKEYTGTTLDLTAMEAIYYGPLDAKKTKPFGSTLALVPRMRTHTTTISFFFMTFIDRTISIATAQPPGFP